MFSIILVQFKCLITSSYDNIIFLTESDNELKTSIIDTFSKPTILQGVFGRKTENLFMIYTELFHAKEFLINKIQLSVGGNLRAGISAKYECEVYQRINKNNCVIKLIFYFDNKVLQQFSKNTEILISLSFLTHLGNFYEVLTSPGNCRISDLHGCSEIIEINEHKLIFNICHLNITGGFLVFQKVGSFYDLSNNLLEDFFVVDNNCTGKKMGIVELKIKNRTGKQGYIVFFKDVDRKMLYKVVYKGLV